MSSESAKKAAGTYIADSIASLPVVLNWITRECRDGGLSAGVGRFCADQPEILEQSLVIAENVTPDCIQCRIPCRCYDHESEGTFASEVRFSIDPRSGTCQRT